MYALYQLFLWTFFIPTYKRFPWVGFLNFLYEIGYSTIHTEKRGFFIWKPFKTDPWTGSTVRCRDEARVYPRGNARTQKSYDRISVCPVACDIYIGVSQPVHTAKLSVVHDGQTHNDGPASARRRRHGGENHPRHPYVPAGKTADGRIRVPESHNHVNSECVYT